MRALGRAGLIIYLICLSVSISPVTFETRHTDGECRLGVFMMATEIRLKEGFSEAAVLNCGMTHCDQGWGMSQATCSLLLVKDQNLQMIHLFPTWLKIQEYSRVSLICILTGVDLIWELTTTHRLICLCLGPWKSCVSISNSVTVLQGNIVKSTEIRLRGFNFIFSVYEMCNLGQLIVFRCFSFLSCQMWGGGGIIIPTLSS